MTSKSNSTSCCGFRSLKRCSAWLTIVVLVGLGILYSYTPSLSGLPARGPGWRRLVGNNRSKEELDALRRSYFGEPPDDLDGARTCKIPQIYPFDETAIYLIESQTRRRNLTPPACLVDGRRFKTDLKSKLIRLEPGSYFWKFVTCCYTPITAKFIHADDLSACIPLPANQSLFLISDQHENLRVTCLAIADPSFLAYRDYFHFFRLKPTIEAKAQKLEDSARAAGPDLLSLVYLGIDSVSNTNFQRYLPKTRNYLVKDLEAIEFSGLNKVGRGTIENLTPTLSGCSYVEGHPVYPNATADCTLVWTEYAKKGYRTVFSEEQYWDILYERLKRDRRGTREVNYDNLAYIGAMQSTTPKHVSETFGCFEHQFGPTHLKERILEVGTKLRGKLYYHHLWAAMTSHDQIGYAKYLDDPFHELLQNLTANKLLENTVLILNSDHGTVSSDYSRTAEGLIEARVPLLYFVFPQWFKLKYTAAIENLKRNARTLSTPHDVHATLLDILDLERVTNSALKNRKPLEKKGISLFLPIPLNRTCESAGVPQEYCICWSWTQMDNPNKDLQLIRAVSKALDTMNKELDKYPKCARLDLESVLDGRVREEPGEGTFYEVTFRTIPGKGIFAAVLKLPEGVNAQFSLVGEVERQNHYRGQNTCLGLYDQQWGWVRSACFCI